MEENHINSTGWSQDSSRNPCDSKTHAPASIVCGFFLWITRALLSPAFIGQGARHFRISCNEDIATAQYDDIII